MFELLCELLGTERFCIDKNGHCINISTKDSSDPYIKIIKKHNYIVGISERGEFREKVSTDDELFCILSAVMMCEDFSQNRDYYRFAGSIYDTLRTVNDNSINKALTMVTSSCDKKCLSFNCYNNDSICLNLNGINEVLYYYNDKNTILIKDNDNIARLFYVWYNYIVSIEDFRRIYKNIAEHISIPENFYFYLCCEFISVFKSVTYSKNNFEFKLINL